jgi:hypothetical protein
MDPLDDDIASIGKRVNPKYWPKRKSRKARRRPNTTYSAEHVWGTWSPKAMLATYIESQEIEEWRAAQQESIVRAATTRAHRVSNGDIEGLYGPATYTPRRDPPDIWEPVSATEYLPRETTTRLKENLMTRHGQMTEQDGSQKQRILALYREQSENRTAQGSGKPAKRKGFVGLNVIDTAKKLGMPPHDVTHALYDLKKQGLVDFRVGKSVGRTQGGDTPSKGSTPYGGIPVRIRITQKGVKMATPTDMEFEDSIPSEADTAALTDDILAEVAEETVIDTVRTGKRPPRWTAGGGNVDIHLTPDQRRNLEYDPTKPDYFEAAVRYLTDPRVAGSEVVEAILMDLPLIQSIRVRAEKVAQAEALLREAGLTEAADLVQGEKEVRTGLEREVLELLRRLNFA